MMIYHESRRIIVDYERSPILQNKLGCLAVFVAIWNSLFKTTNSVWNKVTGSEAGDALIAMVQGSQKVYVFGAPYNSGNGMHDVHYNQGDPAGSQWYTSNGIWQDGCVFALKPEGTL